jgi:ketosteroid isomerase-like protein
MAFMNQTRKLKHLSILLLLVISTQCKEAGNPATESEKSIRLAREKSNAAIARQDTIALAEIWTNDYHIITSRNFEVSGSDNNRNSFASEFASKKELLYVRTPGNIDVFEPWNMASERGTWTGQWLEPDGLVELSGTYFAKWHKINDQWKIRAEIFVPLSCSGSSFCTKTPF